MWSQFVADGFSNGGCFRSAVDYEKALGVLLRKRVVTLADAVVKSGGFVVEPGFVGSDALITAACALLAGGYVDVDEDGKVGLQAGAGDLVEVEDHLRVEAAARALVAKGGVSETVTKDDRPAFESGTDDLLYV